MPRQDKVFVCFQKAEDDTHKLYIYDDVTAYGTFNWSTWSYEESDICKVFPGAACSHS